MRHGGPAALACRTLEDAYWDGKLRSIGVSNFPQDDLESLLAAGEVRGSAFLCSAPRHGAG